MTRMAVPVTRMAVPVTSFAETQGEGMQPAGATTCHNHGAGRACRCVCLQSTEKLEKF